jgi:hypothetical protein
MSELLWVAVPNGLRPPSKASIRVLVVPRLAAGTLHDFGLNDWPAVLAEEAAFSMRTRTSVGERVAAQPPRYVARARSEIWAGFFSGDAGLTNEYEAQPNPVPAVEPSYQDARTVAQTYRTVTRVAANPANNADSAIRAALTALAVPEPGRPPTTTETPTFAIPDFHATVSTLREHPTVLLDLGLVFELIVDVADLNLGTPAAGRQLSIRCTDPPFLRPLVTAPWTRYDLSGTDFRPAPAPGSDSGIRKGMLDLSDSASITSPTAPTDATRWAVATFDAGVVGNLRQAGRHLAANPQVPATMPTVRSVGLALLRPNRRLDFAARVRTAASRAATVMADTVLGADDLVLGYRVDIRREDNPWRSVCERDAQYKIDGVVIGSTGSSNGYVREEGHVKAFPAVKDGNGGLHTDEVVLRWDGWSLALATPNLRGDTSGPVRDPSHPLPYRFEWNFAIPPGRLPALRFADRYQMRVRIADITGSGLKLGDVDGDEAASDTVTYRRHDPIQPPQLRAAGSFAPGAAIDRLVIRSDKAMTPEQLHAADPDYPLIETRTLDPPTASLQLVEQHRMLDGQTDEQSFERAQQAMFADASGSGLPDPAAEGVNATVPAEPGGLTQPRSERSKWVPSWPNQQPKTIELAAHALQVPVTIKWVAKDPMHPDWMNTLKVTLGKAEQATLELSSTIRGDMEDHLAMTDYFSNPSISPDDTKQGRNPVVTPPHRVLVVHAVKRPLAEPLWNLPPETAVERGSGDTTVVLKPTFAAVETGLGLNTDSTGRLDVAASWTEFEDVGPEAGLVKRPVTVTHLHSQSIARGDPPLMRIRHEFGDTKHRTVTYTLNATTRFREYFKPTEPESSFQATREQSPVNVMSTTRPPAPVVLGVVPAFRWQRTQTGPDRIEHVRRSQRLRVELARPWFQTGEGEQLAIVLAPTDTSPAMTSDLITRVGRDPLFGSPATPPRPRPDWFPAAAAARLVTLPELNTQVTIIPFDVTPGGDRWYADIDFAAPAAKFYNPLVQLAVARFQPNSVNGLWLSPVAITDQVPLMPDRRVVVTRVGNQVNISVDGTSPNPLNRLEAILETCPAGIAPETIDMVVDDPAAEPQIPAWRAVPGGTVVRTAAGSIPPLTLVATAGRLRVRIRETENLSGADTGSPSDLLRRNVFVDTVILPAAWGPA